MARIELIFSLLLVAGGMVFHSPVYAAKSPAEERYAAAADMEESGDLHEAERLYRQLRADFPKSIEAEHAGRQIARIELGRKLQDREPYLQLLHRLRNVIRGYQDQLGALPEKLSDFDREGFPFTREYLEKTVPAGFVAYLRILPRANSFQVYVLREGQGMGYWSERESARLIPIQRTAFEAQLAGELAKAESLGRVVLLRME